MLLAVGKELCAEVVAAPAELLRGVCVTLIAVLPCSHLEWVQQHVSAKATYLLIWPWLCVGRERKKELERLADGTAIARLVIPQVDPDLLAEHSSCISPSRFPSL